VIAMVPKSKASKPSRHTLFVLEAMEVNVKKANQRWDKMQTSIDLLFAKLGSQEEVQTQMAEQLNLIAQALNKSSKDHTSLMQQMVVTNELVAHLAAERAQLEAQAPRGGGASDHRRDHHIP
jgi:chromosome segregation ATPase